MNKPVVSIIAAVDRSRGIGKNNRLLWHLPPDLKRFKELTLNHPVVMGRTTFESIGHPLPNRLNIVVTKNTQYRVPDCVIVHSLAEAIQEAAKKDTKEVFIIGGSQIYHQAIDVADKLYLTFVEGEYSADAFFPEYSRFNKVIFKKAGTFNNYKFTFLELIPE